MQFEITARLRHNGSIFEAGDKIELSPAEGEIYAARGRVKPVQKKIVRRKRKK